MKREGADDDVPPVAITRRAREEGGVFCDQFENLANFRAHRDGTGAEICEQLEAQWGMRPADGSRLAFICGAGTGGTLAGVHAALCERFAGARAFLADPQGSSLFNRVVKGVLYTREEAEGKRRANPFDTVVEGVCARRCGPRAAPAGAAVASGAAVESSPHTLARHCPPRHPRAAQCRPARRGGT